MMYDQRRIKLSFSFTIDSYASHFYLPIPPRRNPTHVSSSPITPINLPRADAIAMLNKFGFDGLLYYYCHFNVIPEYFQLSLVTTN